MALSKEIETKRRSGIASTDAAPICGMSPWKSPGDVWVEKKRPELVLQRKKQPSLEWGTRLEPIIADKYAEVTGQDLAPADLMVSRDVPWMMAQPDRLIVGKKKGLECKTGDDFSSHEWGKEGTDQVPQQYLIQVNQCMMVTGFDSWDVAALLGGNDFRIYHLFRDDELFRMIYETEEEFFRRFIEGDEQPSFDWGKGIQALIRAKWPKHKKGDPINVDDNGDLKLKRTLTALAEIKSVVKTSKKDEEVHKAVIQSYMGDIGSLVWKSKGINISWRNIKDSTKIDWHAIYLEVLSLCDLDGQAIKAIIQKNLETVNGVRRFVVRGKFGDDDE